MRRVHSIVRAGCTGFVFYVFFFFCVEKLYVREYFHVFVGTYVLLIFSFEYLLCLYAPYNLYVIDMNPPYMHALNTVQV